MPPRRGTAATQLKSVASKKKPARKSQSKKKRSRDRYSDSNHEEEEEQAEVGKREEEEKPESPAAISRAKKKAKREAARSPSPAAAARTAAAASSSALAHLVGVQTNVTLRCDSDSLSLVFGFLTTVEFNHIRVVDKRWCTVSRVKTSWPRCYHYESAISMYQRMGELQPHAIDAKEQHRQVKLMKWDVKLVPKSRLAKHLHSLHIDWWFDASGRGVLTATNFSHLTELEYEPPRVPGEPMVVDPATEDAPLSLASQLRVLKLIKFETNEDRTRNPFVITPRVLASFTHIEVLVLTESRVRDEYLVNLHHLRYFRVENLPTKYQMNPPDILRLSTIRIVRYLSIVHALRSFLVCGVTLIAEKMIKILGDSSLSEVLALVEADHAARTHRGNLSMLPPFIDPIPKGDDRANSLLATSTHAELHEFEAPGCIDSLILPQIMSMPLRHLTCSVASSAVGTRITFVPLVNIFPETTALQQMQHLDLTIDRIQTELHPIAKCEKLISLRLCLKSERPWANRDFSDWLPSLAQLEELTLEWEHITPATMRINEATWSAMGEIKSLRRLDLKLSVNQPFPLELLAESLASLSQFNRLDLRLTCIDHTLSIPVGVLAAVASSSSWRLFHFTVSSRHKRLVESKAIDLKQLSSAELLSESIQKFRLFRHCRTAKVSTTSAQTSLTTDTRSQLETTWYRIGVKETKSLTAKYQPDWICVDEEE